MIVGDYVRTDNGVLHIVAGGIDTFHVPSVPYAQNVGIGVRILLTRDECSQEHSLEIKFQDADGEELTSVYARFRSPYPDHLLAGTQTGALLPLNLRLPLPKVGRYSFELFIDGHNAKSIPMTVVQVPPARTGVAGPDA